MKKFNKPLAFAISVFALQVVYGQEKTTDYKVSIYGFARMDYIMDTRQNLNIREEQVDLYPLDVLKDAEGKDINDAGTSNFLAITSRIGVKASGPEVWGAKTGATIEADFFGNTNGNTGALALRHAYATLDWEKTSLLLGQTWLPAFVPEVMPGVANFNTGILFNPFARGPQVKLSQHLTPEISVDLVAYKTAFHSPYSIANASSGNDPFINSMTPALHAKIQYKNKTITAGVGGEYQSIRPRLAQTTGTTTLVNDNKVNSGLVMAYFKYANEKFTGKLYGVSGSNLYQYTMLGGYVGYPESATLESYKPTKATAFWADFASNSLKVAPGLFFGYTKNNGVSEGFKTLYTRGITATRALENVWRVAGRVEFKQNKFKIAPEVEYTSATYGNTNADATAGTDRSTVGNLRLLASVVYSF